MGELNKGCKCAGVPVIKVKYLNPNMTKIEKIDVGDWIDLRSENTIELKEGEFKLVSLGVCIKIPEGYEAHLAPRSSTFKNYGILQTNSVGVIDESYSGNDDVWKMPVYATRDTTINEGERICQFRIIKKMPPVCIEEVDDMTGPSRGGFGSTGVK